MSKSSERGEIATLLTIGTVIFLGISTLISSALLKNQQTTKSKASTTCDDPNWFCLDECADSTVRSTFTAVYGANAASQWKIEKANNSGQPGACGGTSTSQPAGTTSQSSGSGTNNGCFTLSAEFEPKNEGGKWAFYSWVRFSSSKAGDVQLMYNGIHTAGWNRFTGGEFVYDPNWTQPYAPGSYVAVATMSPGQSITASYQGFLSGCTPQDITVSCTLTAGSSGASVSGNGCICRGCSSSGSTNTVPPTAVPTTSSNPGGIVVPTTATRLPTDIPVPTAKPTVIYTSTPIPTYASGHCTTVGALECFTGTNSYYIKTCGTNNIWIYSPCPDNGTCTKTGNIVKCIAPTPTTQPSATPKPDAASTSTPVPPTFTPTPTPLSSLPNTNEIVNTRGTITVLIPFENSQYLKYFTNQNFSSAISGIVKKTKYCSWYSSCTQSPVISYSNEGVKVTFKNLGRYVDEYGLKQAPYTVDVSFLGEDYYKSENVVFNDYGMINISLTSTKKINLASFLKIWETKITVLDSPQYVYQDIFTVSTFNPFISFYELDGVLYPYPNDGQLKLTKDKTFRLIYSYFDYFSLPNTTSLVVEYACGNASQSSVVTLPLNVSLNKDSVETVQSIGLICSKEAGG